MKRSTWSARRLGPGRPHLGTPRMLPTSTRYDSDPSIGRGQATFLYALLALYIFGFHLRLSLYSGAETILIPNYLMLVSAAILALSQINALLRRLGLALLALTLFVALQPIASFAPLGATTQNLMSAAQLWASIVAALAVIYTASRLGAPGLQRLALTVWLVLIVIALLETLGYRDFFHQIQEFLYSTGRSVYNVDARDLDIYGKVRPAALASEPSYLSASLSSMAILTFMLDRSSGRPSSWIKLCVMMFVGFLIAPSMTMVFYIIALLVWHFWPRSSTSVAWLFAGVAVALIVGAMVALPNLQAIMSYFGSTGTGSFFARVAVGPYIGWEVLSTLPILGFGIGNVAALTPVFQHVWVQTGGFSRFPWYSMFDAEHLLANGFWWQFVYLGCLGVVILTLIIGTLLSKLGVRTPFRVILCTWIVWYAGAAFVDPASWFTVALFAMPLVSQTWDSTPARNSVPSMVSAPSKAHSSISPQRN